MNLGRTVFSQITEHLPEYEFQKCVDRYRGDSHFRGFSCLDQYLAMAFAQLTYRESLRDIEACLRSVGEKLYHMGLRGKVSRTTLADANESHDWRIFADFAQILIGIARPLYLHDPIGVDLDQSLYALDSTTIDLCLSLFPWAKFRKHKAAVKMHTLLDLHGNIPTFIRITSGVVHDVNLLDEILPEAGAIYVFDRGYIDFQRLFKFLTNNFTLPALTIAQIYKSRWQIELFFRWIKQHLRIKEFYGTSENAVKTQIWIAVSVYVLVAIIRKRMGLDASLYQILQILSVTLFEKTPILQALQTHEAQVDLPDYANPVSYTHL